MPGKQNITKQREDAAHKGKNKCLMGPLKSLGALGEYPCSPPPRWAWQWFLKTHIAGTNRPLSKHPVSMVLLEVKC